MALNQTTPTSLLSIPTAQAAPSLGTQAKNPTQNIPAPTNKLPTNQQAAAPTIKDLSGTYANVNGTIYNKSTGAGYSDPNSFFKDAGINSFNNLKFDTTWRPPTTNTGNGTPPAQSIPTGLSFGGGSQATGSAPAAPTATAAPAAPATTADPTKPYSPPNQGTTGVSQGGIIGNLLGIAQNESPQVTTARANLQNLQNEMAQETANIKGSPFGLSEQLGQQGILNQLFATKQAAAQQALQNALTSQGQSITATQGAGQLNAPIIASPGQVQLNPSQPTPGATTSGAVSLNSLIGQRPGATGVTEFYNKSTGQGFATPQDLANFINQQQPGANVTAANVFQYLQSNGNQGSNLLGLDQSTMQTYAQMLASGQGSAIPSSITGNAALMAQLYNMANSISGGNFNTNVAAGLGAGQQANAAAAATAAVNAANSAYAGYYKDYLDTKATVDTVDQFGNLLTSGMVDKNGNVINPTNLQYANMALSTIRGLLSSQQQAQFDTTFAALKSKVSGLLAVGGSETPSQLTADANSILSGSVPLGTLQATLDRIKQEGQTVVNIAAQKGNTALSQVQGGNVNSQPSGSNTGGFTEGQTAAGGAIVFKNGKWVANQ